MFYRRPLADLEQVGAFLRRLGWLGHKDARLPITRLTALGITRLFAAGQRNVADIRRSWRIRKSSALISTTPTAAETNI
jgi:hypothetical protein